MGIIKSGEIKKNRQKGITLISLVVTIIILLILAGISIGMLSGDNSILRQAGNSKKQTDIAGEKEILQISAVSAMGKTKYGDITKEKLDAELDKNIGNGNYSSESVDDGIEVTFTNSGRSYIVDYDGNVEKKTPSIEITEAKVVTNSNGTGGDVTANSKTEGTDILYISFKPILSGGSITSVTYNGNTITPQNGIYVLEISKNGDYDFIINGVTEGQNVTTPYTKNVNKYELWGGIEIGDYITYEPTEKTAYSEHLTTTYTGYTSNQTLGQQYKIWRVLNKNPDGSLDIIPAFKDSEVTYTDIYFKDAKGYNNAVTILDETCDYLYENEAKGITARSIDYEDVESHMKEGLNDTEGLRKISKYYSDAISNLTLNSSYSIEKDTTNNTVTYVKARSWYPNIYTYQEGAGIDIYSNTNGTISYGLGVWQKEEEREIEGNIIKSISESDKINLSTSNLKTQANNLTAKYTYYNGTIKSSDFTNSNAHSVIFGTSTNFWLASRCVNCESGYVKFGLDYVSSSALNARVLFNSNGNSADVYFGWKVCPVVSLDSNVQVTKCTGANSQTNRHTVVIPN